MNKKVAIHQPNYIPWIGYFAKMEQSDYFVYLDIVQYPRGKSVAARNLIKTPNGPAYLTIPVKTPAGKSGKALYTEIQFADSKWKEKHKKTIELNYKKTPHFNEVFELFRIEMDRTASFTDLNINLIETFADYMDIPTRRFRLSSILKDFGQKSDLIIDICEQLNARVYLSGDGGGKDYNDEALLKENGIMLEYLNFKHPQYNQLWGEFVPNLSILDLLFNHGKESRDIILSENPK